MEILFLCKANVGRSQIAAAFFNRLTQKRHANSAGTHVDLNQGSPLHHFVVQCMAELNFDLSKNTRRQLTPEISSKADKIIVMTDKKNLPDYLQNSEKLVFWEVPDAKDKSYEFHCKMRDQVKKLVEKLIEELP